MPYPGSPLTTYPTKCAIDGQLSSTLIIPIQGREAKSALSRSLTTRKLWSYFQYYCFIFWLKFDHFPVDKLCQLHNNKPIRCPRWSSLLLILSQVIKHSKCFLFLCMWKYLPPRFVHQLKDPLAKSNGDHPLFGWKTSHAFHGPTTLGYQPQGYEPQIRWIPWAACLPH
jgi:hypothetical protein